jgi:hypothetical protein
MVNFLQTIVTDTRTMHKGCCGEDDLLRCGSRLRTAKRVVRNGKPLASATKNALVEFYRTHWDDINTLDQRGICIF